MTVDRAAVFEAHRGRLQKLAYRMLGTLEEAEDAVQDAWLRWSGAAVEEIAEPAAWLVRVTTRLCIDRLRAAKVERAAYRGPWLPEPLIEPLTPDPLERAEDVSVAFLLALERLSPLERAVFLLHDVFDEDYGAIATILSRSDTAVRQLASRARQHVREARPRFPVDQEEARRLATAFVEAAAKADTAALAALLTEDAILVSDGGGKRPAALRVLVGRHDVIGLLKGLALRGGDARMLSFEPVRVNGYPGFIIERPDGLDTMAFQPGGDGQIAAIYMVRNPDKLTRVRSPAKRLTPPQRTPAPETSRTPSPSAGRR
ncbi:MAG: RNA polymerase sigma factor SigJ [Caulobacterales bacterium]|nr:RNA polymerase sigma factor SigJ [Caulobacterales bacterium]